jgi:hypothetical protein
MNLSLSNPDRRASQALLVWLAFFVLAILINGSIPFLLGRNLQPWTSSTTKSILFSLIVYGGIFLAVPLILVKGWRTVHQPAFLIPLILAIIAVSLWQVFRGIAVVAVIVLAYLHWRYDLSELGIRSMGWKGDLIAILLIGILGAIPALLRPGPVTFAPGAAVLAGLDRLFANPASTVETLFYFGFLAESLSYKAGKWLTPILIGLMYTAHEMTNPEYWYTGTNFLLICVGVSLFTVIYLWRRSVVTIWLGDGLGRFLRALV